MALKILDLFLSLVYYILCIHIFYLRQSLFQLMALLQILFILVAKQCTQQNSYSISHPLDTVTTP